VIPIWYATKDGDEYFREMYERHYSNYRYRDGRKVKLSVGPGEKLLLRTWKCDAIWAWRKFIDDSGQSGINCAIFRNESKHRSSELIRQADYIAFAVWPGERHYTYVNAEKIRSTNAGCCFKAAGWRICGKTKKGLIILELLPEDAR
jgi:hypothetical protein